MVPQQPLEVVEGVLPVDFPLLEEVEVVEEVLPVEVKVLAGVVA